MSCHGAGRWARTGEVFGVLEEALAGGILALRRILTRQLTTMTQENRGLPAQAGAAGGAAATTVVELETQSTAGNPTS